jgi:SAM-dependent methyltransferase
MAQLQTTTWENRYSEVFQTVQIYRRQLGLKGIPRILSFGCSHGQELRTLKAYFPEAALFGCDVNSEALANSARIPGCTIFRSSRQAIEAFGPFDVITAMSVLCRFSLSQSATSLKRIFPFSEFEDHLESLHRTLSDGGVLCIHNANYLFSQSQLYSGYAPLRSNLIVSNGYVDKWSADDLRITRVRKFDHGREHEIDFRPEYLRDSDFRDVCFVKGAANTIDITKTASPEGHPLKSWEQGADLIASARDRRIATRSKREVIQDDTGSTWIGTTLSMTNLAGEICELDGWWARTELESIGYYTPDQERWLVRPVGRPKRKHLLHAFRRWKRGWSS